MRKCDSCNNYGLVSKYILKNVNGFVVYLCSYCALKEEVLPEKNIQNKNYTYKKVR